MAKCTNHGLKARYMDGEWICLDCNKPFEIIGNRILSTFGEIKLIMKKLQYLVIHCTATQENIPISSDKIRQWHMGKKPGGRGWSRVGYTDMIHLTGKLENLSEFDQDDYVDNAEMTWGAKGVNSISRHIVYVGGNVQVEGKLIPKDTRTPQQLCALMTYVHYTILRHPEILIAGHNAFSSKACPSFDVATWCRSIGVREENIYTGEL